MKRIDLNVDIGEGMPHDAELLGIVSSANIGLGAHAGSFRESIRVANLAEVNGVNVGAHPGYPDRTHFGRISPDGEVPAEWVQSVLGQLERFFATIEVDYVKPHGALYHDLAKGRSEVFGPFTEWLAQAEVPLMGMKGTEHERLAAEAGVELIAEGFVERGYDANGFLIPRGSPGAQLHDLEKIQAQAVALANLGIPSLCVHGDRPDAVLVCQKVKEALLAFDYHVGRSD